MASAIEAFAPRTVSPGVASFAKELAAAGRPESVTRAKAFLFAASRLGAFCVSVGVELSPGVALHPSVIERCCAPGVTTMAPATRRTVRTNLRAIARARTPAAPPVHLGRERAKPPYSRAEIDAYLALADAQPTEARRQRANALVCLSAGAGLVGADLKAVRGSDVVARSGGLVVTVSGGRHPRVVPVLSHYHDRLGAAAAFAGAGLAIGGVDPWRKNVTTPITASLAGGADLARLEIARLRATWLVGVAQAIGLRAFLDAAGISCSQRLGDLVATVSAVQDDATLARIGGWG